MVSKRVIVIEDGQDMADLVCRRLQREGYAVGVAADGIEGLEKVRSEKPDLVVLDIMLPRVSGTEVLKELRNDPAVGDVAVVMATARGEQGDIIAGLQLGADDYVTKPFNMSELVARIEAVLRRRRADQTAPKDVLCAGPIRVDQGSYSVSVGGRDVSLTLTEFKLLTAILSARGRVLTRSHLIDRAIGQDAVVTDRTIDVHMAALRRKLGKARKHIQTVRGVGYWLAVDLD